MVVVCSTVVVVSAPVVVVSAPVVVVCAPVVVVAPTVVVVAGSVVVVEVVGGVSQPVTQNTLYLVSAPWAPSAWMVSLTWTPWFGCGVIPVRSRV